MSEPSETSGRPLASTTKQPQATEGNTRRQPTSRRSKHHKISQSSNDQLEPSNNTDTPRRPGSAEQASPSPTNIMSQLSSVHYTRTGRISKAKKGLKVHNCENCGRVSYIPFHLGWSSPPGEEGCLSTPLCCCLAKWAFLSCPFSSVSDTVPRTRLLTFASLILVQSI